MISKQILIGSVVFVIVVGVGSFVILNGRDSKTSNDLGIKTEVISPTAVPTKVALATWTDEAGFSFQYPEGLIIDNHPEDKINYANLTFTLPSQDLISIVMSDNKYKNLNAWAGENPVLDTTLGGQPAVKINKDDQTIVACIDNGVLVTITGKDVSSVVDSWNFIYPTTTASKNSGTSSDGGDVLEEE